VTKLLAANRGEIACRIFRAARKVGIPTVAIYSKADEEAVHVQSADEARFVGGPQARESYLNQEAILFAARETGATLIHPGYGFLAENAGFAERCAQAGITFVGPKPSTIAAMGDKHRAREMAIAAGVPVLPGSGKLSADEAEIAAAGKAIGFPLLVKATAGGGGIGMRLVEKAEDLVAAVTATSGLAARAFGDGSVYCERYVRDGRHVEVQVFGFGNGKAVHLFDRDCSVQRRHQKVIEEALAPEIDPETRQEMGRVSVNLAASCHYDGAGTIEFLYDPARKEFYFLEMNTRIQVEHGVTELVTGVDLVAAQIEHAMGRDVSRELAQDGIRIKGHAVEARIYAEDPARKFFPSPGKITHLKIPNMDGLRIDTGLVAGSSVPPFYDPMVMKVLAHGQDRREALRKLTDALGRIEIAGITTNKDYLRAILTHPAFENAELSTSFLTVHHDALIQQMAVAISS
jgi:acetyl/propionyl-CoA carboxylase alpha subunit